jgi:hypothetical protein
MGAIWGWMHAGVLSAKNIDAPSMMTVGHCPVDMLIQIELEALGHGALLQL